MPRGIRLGIVFALCLFALAARAQSPAVPSSSGQGTSAQPAPTPPGPGATFQQQKGFAASLFNNQLTMEALPLYEDLARQNPGDTEVLLGLGGCLVAHSATLKNEAAARAERIRAREILLRAKQLGSNNGLLLNLLDNLPADGSLRYPGTPEVAAAIADGDAAFAKNDYQEALKNYSKAFELDPKSYSAALFMGDCYFVLKNIPKAAEWYERAIQINPDTETAYRYEADMYTKNGDQQKARELSIKGVVADPYVQAAWRGLAQWAAANKLKLTPVRINTPNDSSGADGKNTTITINPNGNKNSMAVWLVYSGVRLNWRKDEFSKHYPQETSYRHTLAEEVDALTTAAGLLNKEKPETLAADPDLAMLKKLSDAGMLQPYVLLAVPDAGIAVDYVTYRSQNRAKLEQYLSTYVVPPAPSLPPAK